MPGLPGPSTAALLVLLVLSNRALAAAHHLHDISERNAGAVDAAADIYNGLPAPAGMFDWMVGKKVWVGDAPTGQLSLRHLCGGALVAPDAVVTAAHCLRMSDGDIAPSALVLEVQGVPFEAARFLVHPSYDPAALARMIDDFSDGSVDSPLVANYDIAVIRLASPVPNASLIQLPSADLQLAPRRLWCAPLHCFSS